MCVEFIFDNKNNVGFVVKWRTETSTRQSAESDWTAAQVTHKQIGRSDKGFVEGKVKRRIERKATTVCAK